METVSPIAYITDIDPIDQSVPTVSSWFKAAIHTVDSVTPDQLAWLFAQGWEVANITYDEYGNGTGTLRRTEIQSKEVLEDLVQDYIAAYNEGRSLNDQRYDEIVTIFEATLADSQIEFASLEADDAVYDGLLETIVAAIGTDHTTYAADVDGDGDDWGTSVTTRINARFDGKLTSAAQDLTDRGMYNSTVWASVSTGIERERELALSDLADKQIEKQLALKERVQSHLDGVRSRVLAARDRLRATIHNASDRRLASRNALIEAMVSFMERRTDSYPDLAQVGQIATNLGTGTGHAFSP